MDERAKINLKGEGYCYYHGVWCDKCGFINHCKNPFEDSLNISKLIYYKKMLECIGMKGSNIK